MSVSTVLTNPESSHKDNHEPEEGKDYDHNHEGKRIEDPTRVTQITLLGWELIENLL